MALINKLADLISSIQKPTPILVAIDGIDTAGKTILANELILPLMQRGRQIVRASIDGFHRPRKERYKQGALSAEGYYYDSFNYDKLIKNLLLPLSVDGNRKYKTEIFDFRTDSIVNAPTQKALWNTILLFEGVFLFRSEINKFWDYRVFVDINFDEMLRRSVRDKKLFGSKNATLEKFEMRYMPGQKIYLDNIMPKRIANVVIDNNNVSNPKLCMENIIF